MIENSPLFGAAGVDWLNDKLRHGGFHDAVVTAIEIDPLTMTGAFCNLARLKLSYALGKTAGPATLIAKIPRNEENRLAMASAMGLFMRERRFYSELAASVPLRVPRCYYSGGGNNEPLLLEDMDAYQVGEQIGGLTPAQTATAIDALARLHAKFWPGRGEHPESVTWLIAADDRVINPGLCAATAAGVPGFLARYAHKFSPAVVAAAEKVGLQFDQVLQRCTEGPRTLVHGDARANNWMFGGDGDVVLVDWQVAAHARGTQDVAYMLAGSLNLADLKAHGADLLNTYYKQLCEFGVTDYCWEDCLLHYRQHVLHSFYAAFSLLGSLGAGGEFDQQLDEMILRNVTHAQMIHAFDSV